MALDEEWTLTAIEWFVGGGLAALLAIFLMLDQLLGRFLTMRDQEQ